MKKGIIHLIVYLSMAAAAALSVIQAGKQILPWIAGIVVYALSAALMAASCVFLYQDLRNNVIGIMNQSAWFITMAVYYSLLGIMRFCAVNTGRKISQLEDKQLIRKKELSVIKTDGILLLVLNLALSGVALLTIAQDTAKRYSEIMVISIAAYTFW